MRLCPPTLPYSDLPADAVEMLEDRHRRGTPENTLRAWARDLACLTAWKQAAYGVPLDWPESEAVALRFILDHSCDLSEATGTAKKVAGKTDRCQPAARSRLPCPIDAGPADSFYRMRSLPSPFEAPLIRQARARARRAVARCKPRCSLACTAHLSRRSAISRMSRYRKIRQRICCLRALCCYRRF